MSKIKPNTWLPLFGVETEVEPSAVVYVSRLFPSFHYDEAAGTFSLGGVEIISPPAGYIEAHGNYALLGVDIVTPPPPPDDIPVDGGAGVGAFSLLGVEILAVDLGAKENATVGYSLVGVRVDTVLVLSDDAATAGYSLIGVEIT